MRRKQKEVGIAVFGSSEPTPGDALYELARETGKLLARAGYTVVTGGYGGIMEGANKGAKEAGGRTLGVLCERFQARRPNPYLDESITTRDLHERTRLLIDNARGFIVLPGKAGTLAELGLLWALHRAGCLEDRPVVLLGAPWRAFVRYLDGSGMLDRSQLEMTRTVGTPTEAVEEIMRGTAADGGD